MIDRPDRAARPILSCVTTDPPRPTEPGRESPPLWTSSASDADTRVQATAEAPMASDPADSADPPRLRPRAVAVLLALLVLALVLAGYLGTTARAYQERATWGVNQARAIGVDLASTRAALEGTTAELEGVRTQLATAQARITALADEKAQVADDREAQRKLVDYQQRVSEAAGTVASALERCVRGQDQLIAYLGNTSAYSPADLRRFGTEVDGLCQSATNANQALQVELSK